MHKKIHSIILVKTKRKSTAFYESVMDGVKSYQDTVMKGVQINGSAVANPKK